jgi:hypothetical protein
MNHSSREPVVLICADGRGLACETAVMNQEAPSSRLGRVGRRVRPFIPDVTAAVLSVLGAHLAGAGALLGPAFRAAVAERERRDNRDVAEEAIAAVVMASSDLCDTELPARFEDYYGRRGTIALRPFVAALRAGTDTPDWHGTQRPDAHLSEACKLWRLIPDELDRARRQFVLELGGSYLLPLQVARAANLQRARMPQIVSHAEACRDQLRSLFDLEINGGLVSHKEDAEQRLRLARDALAYSLGEVLDAHEELERAAWQEVPERMAALFPPPMDPATIAVEQRLRARAALHNVVENARVVPTDIGRTSEWLERSTIAPKLPDVHLTDFLAEDFRFAPTDVINGWHWLGGRFEGARSRFEHLTSEASHDLDAEAVTAHNQLISSLNHAGNAAARIATTYSMRPSPQDEAEGASQEILGEFRLHCSAVLVAIRSLDALDARAIG